MIELLLLACLPYPKSNADDSSGGESKDCVGTAEQDLCDAVDNDCDGEVDEDAPIWYLDADDDGFGGKTELTACDSPDGYVDQDGDCNDASAEINPERGEICGNGQDDDCDGSEEEGTIAAFVDQDGDGWGGTAVSICEQDVGNFVSKGGDCNDNALEIHPEAPDSCETPEDENCEPGCRDSGLQSISSPIIDRQRDGFWGGYTFYVGNILSSSHDQYGVANLPSDCLFESGRHAVATIMDDVNPKIEIDFPDALSFCGLSLLSTPDGPLIVASENSGDRLYYVDSLMTMPTVVASLVSTNADVRIWGSSVVNVGDLDGSGQDWVAIGADDESYNQKEGAGTVYLVSATDAKGTGSIQSVAVTIFGGDVNHRLGDDIASADVNGDGYPEVIVCGQGDNTYFDGAAFVYDLQGQLSQGTQIPEADAVGSYYYGPIALTEFGHAIAVGDTNGDGEEDLAVSATILNNTGAILHFSGPLDRGIHEAKDADALLSPVETGIDFGSSLTMIDFDNDGLQDIFTSNTDLDGSPTLPSIVQGFYGPDFKDTITFTDPSYDYLGMTLTPMGDYDGDGLGDLLIGTGNNSSVVIEKSTSD